MPTICILKPKKRLYLSPDKACCQEILLLSRDPSISSGKSPYRIIPLKSLYSTQWDRKTTLHLAQCGVLSVLEASSYKTISVLYSWIRQDRTDGGVCLFACLLIAVVTLYTGIF